MAGRFKRFRSDGSLISVHEVLMIVTCGADIERELCSGVGWACQNADKPSSPGRDVDDQASAVHKDIHTAFKRSNTGPGSIGGVTIGNVQWHGAGLATAFVDSLCDRHQRRRSAPRQHQTHSRAGQVQGRRFPDTGASTLNPYDCSCQASHGVPLWTSALFWCIGVYRITGSRSPLNSDAVSLNSVANRFPMLTTAHGQVYLAFCSITERQMILAMLRASRSRGNVLAHDADFVADMLATVLRQGYALRAFTVAHRVLGFAVPIAHGGSVVATVGMRYYATAMPPEEAVARYLSLLQGLAGRVASVLVLEATPGEPHIRTA